MRLLLSLLASAAIAVSPSTARACATFVLADGTNVVVGHNLDQNFPTPGVVNVNRRGQVKRSVSGFDLGLGGKQPVVATWTSKYGSVTFSTFGLDLPDGGMNEAGLVVNEMALGESQFPHDDSLPTMLTCQWIQYQLDNYASVSQVVKHVREINIDGLGLLSPASRNHWHFFVADRSGDYAVIEFINQAVKVYRKGTSAPVPLLCNLQYPQDLAAYNRYKGGNLITRPLFLRRVPDKRFIRCAEKIESYRPGKDMISDSFEMLASIQYEDTKMWSIVYDVGNQRVHFRTVKGPQIRSLDCRVLDFRPTAKPVFHPDIHMNGRGSVDDTLEPWTEEQNDQFIGDFVRAFAALCAGSQQTAAIDSYLNSEHAGLTLDAYVGNAIKVSRLIRQPSSSAEPK